VILCICFSVELFLLLAGLEKNLQADFAEFFRVG